MSVQHLSKTLYWLVLIAILIPTVTWLYFLIDIHSFLDVAIQRVNYPIQWSNIETWQLYLTCLINALPTVIMVWGLLCLRKMLWNFSTDIVFDIQNVRYVKRFALSLILAPCMGTLVRAISSVILSLHHPPGQKTLSIDLMSVDFYVVLVGLLFWLIGKILISAYDISQENKAFV